MGILQLYSWCHYFCNLVSLVWINRRKCQNRFWLLLCCLLLLYYIDKVLFSRSVLACLFLSPFVFPFPCLPVSILWPSKTPAKPLSRTNITMVYWAKMTRKNDWAPPVLGFSYSQASAGRLADPCQFCSWPLFISYVVGIKALIFTPNVANSVKPKGGPDWGENNVMYIGY